MNFCPDLDIFDNRTLDDVLEEIKSDWEKGSGGLIEIKCSNWAFRSDYGQMTHTKTVKACCGNRSINLFAISCKSILFKNDWSPATVYSSLEGSGASLLDEFKTAEAFCYHVAKYLNSVPVRQAILDLVTEPNPLVTNIANKRLFHDDLCDLFDTAVTLLETPHGWLYFHPDVNSEFMAACNLLLGFSFNSITMKLSMEETYGADIVNDLFSPASGTIKQSIEKFKHIKAK